MGNYKKMVFHNELSEFKRWCKEFPPIEVGVNRRFYTTSGYYCSIETIKNFIFKNTRFAGITVVKYNEVEKNFETILDEKEEEKAKKLFENVIAEYKIKNNLQ